MLNHPEKPVRPNPFDGLRRVVFIAGLFFIAWVLLGQVGMRMLRGPHQPMPMREETAVLPSASPEIVKEKDAEIAALRTRLDQMDAKLKILEDVVVASPKPAGTLQPADMVAADRVTHLEEKIKQQEDSLSGVRAQLDELEDKATDRLTALAAFTPLKDAITHGEPFKTELTQIAQLTQRDAKTQAIVAQLAPYAESGAITLGVLQSWFDVSLKKALAASQQGPIMRNLQSLVQIRKVGEQAGSDDESILARAEARLARGDVDAAAKELAALSPPAALVFAAWLTNAEIFLQIRGSVDALQLALQPQPEPAKAPGAATE